MHTWAVHRAGAHACSRFCRSKRDAAQGPARLGSISFLLFSSQCFLLQCSKECGRNSIAAFQRLCEWFTWFWAQQVNDQSVRRQSPTTVPVYTSTANNVNVEALRPNKTMTNLGTRARSGSSAAKQPATRNLPGNVEEAVWRHWVMIQANFICNLA